MRFAEAYQRANEADDDAWAGKSGELVGNLPFIDTLTETEDRSLDRDRWAISQLDQGKERIKATMEARDDKINPKHYKDIVPGFEYFDVMDYMLER